MSWHSVLTTSSFPCIYGVMGIKCVEVTTGKFSQLDIWHVKKDMIVEGIIKYIKDLPILYICMCMWKR